MIHNSTLDSTLVMIFGSFDGLHEGHDFFISESKKLGDNLIIVVAPDNVIEKIKGKKPKRPISERMNALRKKFLDVDIVVGDTEFGKWSAVKKYKPDIVAIGYDQQGLKEALENSEINLKPKIIVINSHKPDIYKSSLI